MADSPSTPPVNTPTLIGSLPLINGGTAQTPPVSLTISQKTEAEFKLLLNDAGTFASKLWSENKFFFLVAIPLIVVIFGRSFLMSLIVSQAKKTINSATKQDTKLANQENQDETQATQLVQTADNLPSQEKPVGDDWYKGQQ